MAWGMKLVQDEHAMTKDRLWLGSFLGLGLLSGCQPPEAPIIGEKVYESESFEVYASEELVACEGTFPAMESWLSSFRARVGENASGEEFRFFWLTEDDYEMSPCQDFSFGCAKRSFGDAYSMGIPLPHEIVHLELRHERPPLFLEEGAAEFFGASWQIKDLVDPVDEEGLFDSFTDKETYVEAGKLTRYLVDEFGDEAYFELYRRTPRDAGRSKVDDVMREVLEVSLDEVLEGYAGFAPACHVENWRSFDYECGEMPLLMPEEDGSWYFGLDMGCEEESVVGPREGRIWMRRAFEVEEATRYELELFSSNGDADARLRVVSCDESCMPGEESELKIDITGVVWRDLLPGRHWFEVSLAEGEASTVEVRVSKFVP